jgi:ribosomal protein S18 acetylase RimI-like enzyme
MNSFSVSAGVPGSRSSQNAPANCRVSIESLESRNAADVEAVAGLHRAYLGDSPIVRLGPRFLRRFYYSQLVEDGLVRCRICRADESIVGFAAYTLRPFDFMGIGLRKHLLSLGGLMLVSLASRPAMIRDVLFVLRLMDQIGEDSREAAVSRVGELLSLVVAPEFQDCVFPGGASRLPVRLVEATIADFRQAGFRRVRFTVQPSNRAANILYSAMGCSLERIERGGGIVHRYTYSIDDRRSEGSAR